MDHKQIREIRDGLHKDLVQEACHKNFIANDNSNGVLQLHNPFYVMIKDVTLLLIGIDCEFGLPIAETYQGNFRGIRYNDLTMMELVDFHRSVVQQKQYTFIPEKELV